MNGLFIMRPAGHLLTIFERVDHSFFFFILRVFGFGDVFLSLLGLLYRDACCFGRKQAGVSYFWTVISFGLGLWTLLAVLRAKQSGLLSPSPPNPNPAGSVCLFKGQLEKKSSAPQVGH